MSLAEWQGERHEYAVHAFCDLYDYVADVRPARDIAVAAATHHRTLGTTVEIVHRTVRYSEWPPISPDLSTGEKP